MIKKIFWPLIVLTIVVVNLFRFWQLDNVPYGFNVDEMAIAVTVTCMETEGVDAHLHPHPVFAQLNYGSPVAPTYTYPGVLWVKLFGHKGESFRGLTAFFNVLTIVGLFFLAQLIIDTPYALLVALTASISPWAWGPSRIGYEATSYATFFIWGMFFFLRAGAWWNTIISALFMACAIYAYSPGRMHIPLIIAMLFVFYLKENPLPKRAWMGFFLALILLCIPLAQGILSGQLQGRFNDISIFNDTYLHSLGLSKNFHDLCLVFFHNYLTHFNPQYLFVSGDPLWEHSTQHFGILSWLDILGLVSLLFFLVFRSKDTAPHHRWLLFAAINFFLGIVPASLTNSANHMSLRTIGSYPFLSLLSGYGLWQLCRCWTFSLAATALTGMVFAFLFLRVYFFVYPGESKGWFSFWTKEEALNAKTDEDWIKFMVRYADDDYHFRYYLINYHRETCSSSRAKWSKVRELLKLPKIY
jgi:hypothetical protein